MILYIVIYLCFQNNIIMKREVKYLAKAIANKYLFEFYFYNFLCNYL